MALLDILMKSFIEDIDSHFSFSKEDEIMNFIQTLCGIENYRPNLNFIKSFLGQKIEEIEAQSKIVVVGGTNGKGETAHCLRQLCYESGVDTCMWTSPHVLSIRERFIHNQSPITYEDLSRISKIVNDELKNERLSYYEFLLCVFLYWSLELKVQVIILEVGLGGRFDGVNLFKNPLTIITSISRDHTKILGNTLKEILFEKYGITRVGGELITGVDQDYLVNLLKEWTKRDGISLTQIKAETYRDYNQKMAACAFEKLGYKLSQLPTIWEQTKGRFESMTYGDTEFVFVGAHNIDGHRKMLELLNKKGQNICNNDTIDYGQCVLSFSKGREDQVLDILNLYKMYPCIFKNIILTSFQDQKAMDDNEIKSFANEVGGFSFTKDWTNLFNGTYKKIFITGSYYFIGAFQRHLLSFRE